MHGHFGERPSRGRLFELVETRALRRRMEAAIDVLLATLDALDGESDLEPANDDEPSLGWPRVGRGAAGREDGPATDAGDDDREYDGADDEPSLAATENHPGGGWSPFLRRDRDGAQTAWARGGSDERELDDADDEEGGDLEEACEDEGCDGGDRENDMAEWGIADFDGVAEQFGRGGRFGEGAI